MSPLVERAPRRWLLEAKQRFSRSLVWQLQRAYYQRRGVDAWRTGEIPHYVTSNPTVANAYAEIVFATARDCPSTDEPLHVCEIGGGSGRFAFHFLQRLASLCAETGVALESFRYLLTDCVDGNRAFWRAHPAFRPFFARGVLEVGAFDAVASREIALDGRVLRAGDLRRPLVAVANYVLDSLPTDLFYLEDGACSDCLVSLLTDEDPQSLDEADLLPHLRIRYHRVPLGTEPYDEPLLARILSGYRAALARTHLLFPAVALRCLDRLRALSERGLVLLAADKGDHRLAALDGKKPPRPVRHGGAFSLNANFHAVKAWTELAGGVALFPDARHHHIDVACCLATDGAGDLRETARAFRRHLGEFGPDDFYSVMVHGHRTADRMGLEELLAHLRLGRFDAFQLARLLPRLHQLAPSLRTGERERLRAAVDRVWEGYFPLGEQPDLAFAIAELLYALDDVAGARDYLARSIALYGPHEGSTQNLALCDRLLAERNPS